MSEKNPFAGDVKPSMQRRSQWADYRGRRMYMVTMVIEGRRPLLGEVVGDVTAPEGSASAPRTIPSPLGVRVQENFYAIARRYAQVEVLACQLMPDHLHGILFVKEQMEKDLSRIIRGFKTGCNRHFRALYPAASASSAPSVVPSVASSLVPSVATQSQPTKPDDRTHGLLFARGFNDKLLLREGQLQRWLDYLADNPRRLLLKRARPDLLRVRLDVDVCGRTCSAVGNLALLSAPEKLRVRISRSIDPALLEQEKSRLLAAARAGAVLVSPAISPGEKAVTRAAFDEGLPLIVLLDNGLAPIQKPSGERFRACAEGRLLLLSPFPHRNHKVTITRQVCEALNGLAWEISGGR